MDDLDISFDFESNLSTTPVAALPSSGPAQPGSAVAAAGEDNYAPGSGKPRFQQYVSKKNFRQTVCRHWLRGLCMKGDQCGFLHQFDQSRMPVCRFFAKYGVCREAECVFKHSTEEVKECNMFNLGFCIHGPLCRYKHVIRPGPPPEPNTVEAAKPKEFRNLSAVSAPRGGGGHQRAHGNTHPSQIQGQEQRYLPAPIRQPSACQPSAPPQQSQPPPPPQPASHTPPAMPDQSAIQQGRDGFGGMPQSDVGVSSDVVPSPPPKEVQQAPSIFESCRFFVLHVRDKREFGSAKMSKQWSTSLSNRMKLNEAFKSKAQNVVLLFIDQSEQICCGCARMEGLASQSRSMMVRKTPGMGGIPLKWLSLDPVPLAKINHIKSEGSEKSIGQYRDGQELDTESGKLVGNIMVPNV